MTSVSQPTSNRKHECAFYARLVKLLLVDGIVPLFDLLERVDLQRGQEGKHEREPGDSGSHTSLVDQTHSRRTGHASGTPYQLFAFNFVADEDAPNERAQVRTRICCE